MVCYATYGTQVPHKDEQHTIYPFSRAPFGATEIEPELECRARVRRREEKKGRNQTNSSKKGFVCRFKAERCLYYMQLTHCATHTKWINIKCT